MKIFKYIKQTIVFGLALFCLTLALQSPSYAANLEGSWQLESLSSVPVLDDAEITAQFVDDPDNVVYGSGGCNRYFAPVTPDSVRIEIGDIASTKMFCEGDIMRQEYKYFDALNSATSYKVSDQNLQLNYGNNESLIFIKAR
jgi:heat shock protein HslJ